MKTQLLCQYVSALTLPVPCSVRPRLPLFAPSALIYLLGTPYPFALADQLLKKKNEVA